MSGWQTAHIASFCKTGTGGTPSRSKMERYYEGGTIPWVKSGELRETIIKETEEHVTEAALKETNVKLVPKGALLLAMYGATIGRLGILGVPATTNQAVCHIIPDQRTADVRYLYHALRNQFSSLVQLGVGGAQPNISQGIIKELSIPLPPIPEQRRIADILDRAEALRAKRREALTELDGLAQAIFIDMFGDPVTNPKGWDEKPLTEACHAYSGGTPPKSNTLLWQGNLPWFSPKDIKSDNLFDSIDHVNEDVPKTTNIKLLPANTVVVVVRGMILAHTFQVSVIRVPATINQDMKALLPRDIIEPQFLAACIRSQARYILDIVSEAAHGTKRLDAEGLHSIKVILPPQPLQREFTRCIAAVEKLRVSHRSSLAELDALFASLQHRAFRGEL